MRRLIVAITGASGAIYGVQLLRRLRGVPDIETHLLLSAAGVLNVHQELDLKRIDGFHRRAPAAGKPVYGISEFCKTDCGPCRILGFPSVHHGLVGVPIREPLARHLRHAIEAVRPLGSILGERIRELTAKGRDRACEQEC